jgi:hypothetical protein
MQSILGRDGIATALHFDGDIQAQKKGVTPFFKSPARTVAAGLSAADKYQNTYRYCGSADDRLQ